MDGEILRVILDALGRAVNLPEHDADPTATPSTDTPPMTAMFAMTMLATTAHGDAYTFAQYDQIFTRGGFARNEFHPLPPTMQQAVVSTRD